MFRFGCAFAPIHFENWLLWSHFNLWNVDIRARWLLRLFLRYTYIYLPFSHRLGGPFVCAWHSGTAVPWQLRFLFVRRGIRGNLTSLACCLCSCLTPTCIAAILDVSTKLSSDSVICWSVFIPSESFYFNETLSSHTKKIRVAVSIMRQWRSAMLKWNAWCSIHVNSG